MKKIIQIFIMIHMVVSMVSAEANNKMLEEYWESSRAENMFQLFKKGLKRMLITSLNVDENNISLALKDEINKFINNPKYLHTYKDTFFLMDTTIQKELKVFYNTSVGRKYKRIFDVFDTINYKTKKDIKNTYMDIINNKLISKEKMELISEIDRELNLIEIKMNYKKSFVTFQRQVLFPELNTTNENIDKFMVKYKVGLQQYESMLMPVLFQNFSEEELNKILKYASSKILMIELDYMYKASLAFSMQSYSDLTNILNKLANMRSCQDYTSKSEYIPKTCKPEWLSDVNQSVKQ